MRVIDTRTYVGMLRELTEAGKEVSLIQHGSFSGTSPGHNLF